MIQFRLKPGETPGKLIAAEGLDGSGKSTQIYLLKRWLELEGHKVAFTEWNSSALVKDATRKGKKRQILTPTTFSLIHGTDFADRYERQILPLLRGGYIVLADRYIYTLMARDIVRGANPDWIKEVYSIAIVPDAVFYLSAPPGRLPSATCARIRSWIIGNRGWTSAGRAICTNASSGTNRNCKGFSAGCGKSTGFRPSTEPG